MTGRGQAALEEAELAAVDALYRIKRAADEGPGRVRERLIERAIESLRDALSALDEVGQ